MTILELIAKLEAEVQRADAYHNKFEGTPFGVLGASPDYIRGGKDALHGVIRLLKEIES